MAERTPALSLLLILALLLAPLAHGAAMAAMAAMGAGGEPTSHEGTPSHGGHDHGDAHAPEKSPADAHSDCSSAGSSIDCCAGCSGCALPELVTALVTKERSQTLMNARIPPLPDPHSLRRPPKSILS